MVGLNYRTLHLFIIWFGRNTDCERNKENFQGEICCCFPRRVSIFQGLVVWIWYSIIFVCGGVASRILHDLVVQAWGCLIATGCLPLFEPDCCRAV
jgi:hypothetical protein